MREKTPVTKRRAAEAKFRVLQTHPHVVVKIVELRDRLSNVDYFLERSPGEKQALQKIRHDILENAISQLPKKGIKATVLGLFPGRHSTFDKSKIVYVLQIIEGVLGFYERELKIPILGHGQDLEEHELVNLIIYKIKNKKKTT